MSNEEETSAEVTRSRKDLRRVRNPERVEFLDVAGGVLGSWDGIERMQRLQALRVINSAVPPLGPLAVLPGLVWLHAQNARVPEIAEVGSLRQLKTLVITVPRLDFDLGALGVLTRLEHLDFAVDRAGWPLIDLAFLKDLRELRRLSLTGVLASDASPLLALPETIEQIRVTLTTEVERDRVRAQHPEAGRYCSVHAPAPPRDPIQRRGDRFVTRVDADLFGATDYDDAVTSVRRHLRKHAPELLDQVELRWDDSVEVSAASRETLARVLAVLPEGPWELPQ